MDLQAVRNIARMEAAASMGLRIETYQTLDATPVIAQTIELGENTGGQFMVEVVGKNDGGTGSVTGTIIVRYDKTTMLFLGTPEDVLTAETDMTGAGFAIVNDAENFGIELTGHTDIINWIIRTTQLFQTATNTP